MDGDTGLEVISPATGVLNDLSGLRQFGLLPFNLYKAGRQAGACMNLLGNQGWLAREEVP